MQALCYVVVDRFMDMFVSGDCGSPSRTQGVLMYLQEYTSCEYTNVVAYISCKYSNIPSVWDGDPQSHGNNIHEPIHHYIA